MARLTFYGAVEGVTGSAYLLTTESASILLECGLYQGRREEESNNRKPFPCQLDEIDAIVLSHAHLDHSGRVPMAVRQGYAGPVYMTSPTYDLLEILLRDAASLQQRDADWENRRRKRAGKDEIEPLYTEADVDAVLPLCVPVEYAARVEIADGISVRFVDAGHILGSAIVEIFITEAGQQKKLVFSGDLGNSFAALLRDPQTVADADVLLVESTYGNRDHRSMEDTLDEFEQIITDASTSGGNILIPAFAVGRTQEIIFRLGELYQQGKLKQQAVYLDSPMAIAVTEVYHRYQDMYNQPDAAALARDSRRSLHSFLPVLRYSTSTDDSMAINKIVGGAIIIAGSGMCNGGRIRHHLKHNLWRRQSHVVIVGFQAIGTPGRSLVDGARTFNFGGERIDVKARIHTLGGFSAHADRSQLYDWISHFEDSRPRLFLVHGETSVKQEFEAFLRQHGWSAEIPASNETIEF